MRLRALAAVSLGTLVLSATALLAQGPVPSPKDVLGHDIGEDHFLADYTQLRAYWAKLAAASERIKIFPIGKTSYGQEMVIAAITSPANHARLARLKQISAQLARAKDPAEAAARALAQEGRATVWIDGGLHATESIAAQNIIELAYRLCAGDDPRTQKILDQVVTLVCPANPDGLELVARGYMATRRVGRLPVLYQRYIGHDNNRDHYLISQPEAEAICRAFYQEWYPQIVYNHHQSAPRGTVIFTPPFRDPCNYNVDPMVARGIDLVAMHMNWAFAREGKAGVISRTGAPYSMWWNGGLRTATQFHNMLGILTEVFGSPEPLQLNQPLDRRLPNGDYPMPIAATTWHARDTIEYLMTANFAILELASHYREQLLVDIWRMGRNSIERGSRDHWTVTPRVLDLARERQRELAAANARGSASRPAGEEAAGGGDAERRGRGESDAPAAGAGSESEPRLARAESAQVEAVFQDPARRDPRGYVVPMPQQDPERAVRFLRALQKAGIEVQRATAPFEANGRRFAASCYVISCAQAFRPHLLDMFEPQWHPTDLGKDGEPVRPYDSAGWTLALQMDVEFERVLDPLVGSFEPVDALIPLPAPAPAATAAGAKPRPRVGLFGVWGGDMGTGWTEWLLREHGHAPALVFGGEVEAGDLGRNHDVLIFHTGLPDPGGPGRVTRAIERTTEQGRPDADSDDEVAKLLAALPPFEDWSRARERRVRITRERGVPNLRKFVEGGGTILALGSQAPQLARLFDLPLRTGTWTQGEDGKERRTNNREFFVPGSLLRLELQGDDPIVADVSRTLAAMYRSGSTAFDLQPVAGAPRVDVLARWGERDLLMSGWVLGEKYLAGRPAIVCARLGKGRVVLFGADVVYRGQALATFELVQNAIATSH